MNKYSRPYATLILAVITLVYSSYVAFAISGTILGKVQITQLEAYGGIRIEHLTQAEIWRLFTAQLVHTYPLHMLLNVVSLLVLGVFVEPYVKARGLLALWFIAGTTGTLASSLSGTPPWNLGTGASQAIFGIAAAALALSIDHKVQRTRLWGAAIFALLPALTLDFLSAGYPKPGHIAGFVIGWLLCTGLRLGKDHPISHAATR